MAKGDRNLTMLLEVKNGALVETLTVLEEDQSQNKKPIKHQKTNRRQPKMAFRDAMIDPSKFLQSDLADPNHPTIVLRESGQNGKDDVTFYHFEAFTIAFGPHPEVFGDLGQSPDGPFTNSGNNVVTFEASVDTGIPGPQQFKAGPYKAATNAKNQAFWKFTVVTVSGLKLDPCIIIDQ
jgi:hypothetical protein